MGVVPDFTAIKEQADLPTLAWMAFFTVFACTAKPMLMHCTISPDDPLWPEGFDECPEEFYWRNDLQALAVIYSGFIGLACGCLMVPRDLINIVKEKKSAFAIACGCQFIIMPLFAFIFSRAAEDALLKESLGGNYKKEVCSTDADGESVCTSENVQVPQFEANIFMGIILTGCLPGGSTSNLFTYFVRGDVPLSVAVTFVSTICSIFWIPAMMELLFKTRWGGESLALDYVAIFEALGSTFGFLILGMLIRMHCDDQKWRPISAISFPRHTAKWLEIYGTLVGFFFLIWTTVRSYELYHFDQEPEGIFTLSGGMPTLWVFMGLVQPVGFFLGYTISRAFKRRAGECMAIAFETGIQNFAAGGAIALLAFGDAANDMFRFLQMPGMSGVMLPQTDEDMGTCFPPVGICALCGQALASPLAAVFAQPVETWAENGVGLCASLGQDAMTLGMQFAPSSMNPAAACGPDLTYGCPAPFTGLPVFPDMTDFTHPLFGDKASMMRLFLGRFYDAVLPSGIPALIYGGHCFWMVVFFLIYHRKEIAEEREKEQEKVVTAGGMALDKAGESVELGEVKA